MKILFHLFLWPSALVAIVVLFKTLSGTTNGPSSSSEKIVAILSSLIVLGALYFANDLATKQDKYGMGLGIIVLAWIVFLVMMLVTGLLNTKTWN